MPQRTSPGSGHLQKRLVNLVPRQRVIVDFGCPVNQQEMPGRCQLPDGEVAELQQIGQREVITDLGNHDHVEGAFGKLAGQGALLEPDVVQGGATLARGPERQFGDVDGEQASAPGGQLGGEDANGAARFKRRRVQRARQGGEGRGVLGGLVRTGGEFPRVRVRAVHILEVARGQGFGSVGVGHGG